MKRDMDLIRRICLALEALDPQTPLRGLSDVDQATFFEHAEMLTKAELAEGNVVRYLEGGGTAILWRLTWSGHDFVDASKNDGVWAKVKSKVITSGASFTFDLLKDLLKAEVAKGFPPLG